MKTFTVVTTYAERHWQTYAKRCIESFNSNWSGVELLTFTDAQLVDQSSWLAAFKARHARRSTGNYRFDAVRFAHKVAAIDLAFSTVTSDALIWMDADCVTHTAVEPSWLEGLLGDGEFAYLDRVGKYSECGFMIFDLSSVAVRGMVWALVQLYVSDQLFELKEWHDSFAIDHCRKAAPGLRCVSLSGCANRTGHPLINGPLGEKLDHLKGTRKNEGRSRKSDLKSRRSERYWRE